VMHAGAIEEERTSHPIDSGCNSPGPSRRDANHLTHVVDPEGITIRAAQRAQVTPAGIVAQEGTVIQLGRPGRVKADDLPEVIDVVSERCRVIRGAQILDRVPGGGSDTDPSSGDAKQRQRYRRSPQATRETLPGAHQCLLCKVRRSQWPAARPSAKG